MDTKYKGRKCILDIETESSFPTDGRIICIGIKETCSGEIREFYDRNEEIMLRRFIAYFKHKNFGEIIGFNILYDIRFIFAKCLKYEIPASRFFSVFYTDLMMILKSVKRIYNFNKPGTLNEWSYFLFGKCKISKSASVSSLYHQGKITEIIEYNKNDLELTYKLWKRINQVFEGMENKQKTKLNYIDKCKNDL